MSKGKLFSMAARAHRLLLQYNFGRDPEKISDALKAENMTLARTVVENMDEISLIYRELDHFKATGRILGSHHVFKRKAAQKTADGMSDAELLKANKNLPANIIKYRKTRIPAAPDEDRRARLEAKAQEWERRLGAVREEIKKRNI